MSSKGECLHALDTLINKGARFEGDVFSVLSKSPFVIRSHEFGLADGALDCTHSFDNPEDVNFVERFYRTELRHLDPDPDRKPSDLLLFDVKSSVAIFAGEQRFTTTRRQRSHVAFYICICASDPSYVEVVPNLFQGNLPDQSESDLDLKVTLNTSRISKLPPYAYRLDPSDSPHRMPLAMLPEAVFRIRCCANGHGDYVNPWTQVTSRNWRPQTTQSTHHIRPSEDTQHFSAYLAAMKIYRYIDMNTSNVPIRFDFVGMQPKLADFKLVVPIPGLGVRQYFVQHKLDVRKRLLSKPLSKVFVGRNDTRSGNIVWYFNPLERFDYVFYEFSFQTSPELPCRKEFFFLPERIVPDAFYTTTSKEESFEMAEFAEFRIHMDTDGQWVQRIFDILQRNPQPRQIGPRPQRLQVRPAISESRPAQHLKAIERSGGRHDFATVMTYCHRQLFFNIMAQCAKRRSGLIIVFSNDHPIGDFGFCRYSWTELEHDAFFKFGQPPARIHDLPWNTPITPLYYFTKSLEMTSFGPAVASPQFRRLNSSDTGRLILINLFGADELERPGSLLVIPSRDLAPMPVQQQAMLRNLDIDKSEEFAVRNPYVSHLLDSGLQPPDYSIGSGGPCAYLEGYDGMLWQLLDSFTRDQEIQHPQGYARSPEQYRYVLRALHECLCEEGMRERTCASRQKRKMSEDEADG